MVGNAAVPVTEQQRLLEEARSNEYADLAQDSPREDE
jgi:hypothetical protein